MVKYSDKNCFKTNNKNDQMTVSLYSLNEKHKDKQTEKNYLVGPISQNWKKKKHTHFSSLTTTSISCAIMDFILACRGGKVPENHQQNLVNNTFIMKSFKSVLSNWRPAGCIRPTTPPNLAHD